MREIISAAIAALVTLVITPANGDADFSTASGSCIQITGGTSFQADGGQTLWNGSTSSQDLTCSMGWDCGGTVNGVPPTYEFTVVGQDGSTASGTGHISCQIAFLAFDGTWAIFGSFLSGNSTDAGTGRVTITGTGLAPSGHSADLFLDGVYCHVPGIQSGSPSGIMTVTTHADPACTIL